MTFKFEVFNDRIKPLTPMEGVTGNTVYECEFTFSSVWEGFTKYAVFVGKEPCTQLVSNGKCSIPASVLENEGEIYIGVYATNGDAENLKRISTELIPFDVGSGSFIKGAQAAQAASPDIWEVYLNEVERNCLAAQTAANKAEDLVSDPKLEKTDEDQEITGVKTFKNGIKTDVISGTEEGEIFSIKGKVVEIGGNSVELYSKNGNVYVVTDNGEICVGDNISIDAYGNEVGIYGSKVIINGNEITDPVSKGDLGFNKDESGYTAIGVSEVDCRALCIGSSVFETNSGNLYITDIGKVLVNEKEIALKEDVPDENTLVHKSGNEEISGEKTFKDITKLYRVEAIDDLFAISGKGIELNARDGYIDLHSKGGYIRIGTDTDEFILDENGKATFNGKEIALKEDIVSAINAAIYDSWEAAV